MAGALAVSDRGIRADLGALTTFNTLAFINMCHMVVVKGNCAAFANILTAVRQTAAAGIRDLITGGGTFVTGDVDYLYYVLAFRVAAHSDFNTLGEDCPLFLYATAHGRRFAGNDNFRNIQYILQQRIIPRLTSDLAQYLVFQILHLGIKFS